MTLIITVCQGGCLVLRASTRCLPPHFFVFIIVVVFVIGWRLYGRGYSRRGRLTRQVAVSCWLRGRGYSCRWHSILSPSFEASPSLESELRHLIVTSLSCLHGVGGGDWETAVNDDAVVTPMMLLIVWESNPQGVYRENPIWKISDIEINFLNTYM